MKQDNSEKNLLRGSQIGRRQLLKSMAATGGLAAAHPFLESASWAIHAETPAITGPPQQDRGPAEVDNLSKIKGGKRIDVHHHGIFSKEYEQALQKLGVSEQSSEESGPANKLTTAESILETADELGQDGTIFFSPVAVNVPLGKDKDPSNLYQSSNEGTARLVTEASKAKKFGFFAVLPLPDVPASLKQMEYALDTLHADGLGFPATQGGVYLGTTDYDELYAEMNRRSVVAFIHPTKAAYKLPVGPGLGPGVNIAENLFSTTRVGINLIYNGVTTRYPNIKWILAHMGGTLPYVAARLEAQRELYPDFEKRVPEGYMPSIRTQFYYDTASSTLVPGPMAAVTALVDSSHILYGSDYPAISKKRIANEIVSFRQMPQLSGNRLEGVERGNAIRLFKRFA